MNKSKNNISDEEDDLESLRLAALQSLKKPNLPQNSNQFVGNFKKNGFNGISKRGRGRQSRNGGFGSRVRSSNLITIPTVPLNDEIEAPKLILPQDRYSGITEEKSEDSRSSSKFNRYNDSDKSEDESESEPESVASENGSPKKLERTGSLEALLQELENEIEGDKAKADDKERKAKVKKPKKLKVEEPSPLEQKENVASTPEEPPQPAAEPPPQLPKQDANPKTPPKPRPFPPKRHYAPPQPTFIHHQPPPQQHIHHFDHHPFAPYNPPNTVFFPLRLERPPSPLSINADLVTATISAPLSPRSAAFVLQNREIVERRKRSPRRSYSRSPSPRFRRSRSPFSRSPPPSYRSPRRVSPQRRVYSPGRNRDGSPVVSQLSPKVKKASPGKPPVKERLGNVVKAEEKPTVEGEKATDPVMEARKRKFESNEIKKKEGVIKLKQIVCETDEKKDEVMKVDEEEEELDESILDMKFDELFEDEEETDEENEGRFKLSNQQKSGKPVVVPFTQLVKQARTEVKSAKLSSPKEAKKPRLVDVDKQRIARKVRHEKRERRPEKDKEKPKITAEVTVARIEKEEIVQKTAERKVAVATPPLLLQKICEDEPEVIIDNEEEEINKFSEGGDLRAQLSRKRAERQNKVSLVDGVPTRLFETALEGAVFKKAKKRSKETKDTAPKEGKTSIHSRLGVATEPLMGKKKRRKKNRGKLDQVLCFASNFTSYFSHFCRLIKFYPLYV